jgi:hypothetical protein
MDIEMASAFVHQHGDTAELARLTQIQGGPPPAADVTDSLLVGQRPDGAWAPFWAPDYGSLDATCYRLALARQLGLTTADERIARALTALAARQQADGRWEEDADVSELAPPWSRPGDSAATLYLTANCAFWLLTLAGNLDGARLAANFLWTQRDEEGRLPSFWHATWLAAALWHALEYGEAANLALRSLESGVADLSAGSLAWLISALRLVELPANEPLLVAAAAQLDAQQQADGRWPSDDGGDRDVATTIDALEALRLCGYW